MSQFTVGDTAPTLTGTVNASLVGATVEAHLRKPGSTVLTRAATVTDAASGAWSLSWGVDDLDEDGVWAVEVQVTFSDETVQTFGPSTFRVRPQIA